MACTSRLALFYLQVLKIQHALQPSSTILFFKLKIMKDNRFLFATNCPLFTKESHWVTDNKGNSPSENHAPTWWNEILLKLICNRAHSHKFTKSWIEEHSCLTRNACVFGKANNLGLGVNELIEIALLCILFGITPTGKTITNLCTKSEYHTSNQNLSNTGLQISSLNIDFVLPKETWEVWIVQVAMSTKRPIMIAVSTQVCMSILLGGKFRKKNIVMAEHFTSWHWDQWSTVHRLLDSDSSVITGYWLSSLRVHSNYQCLFFLMLSSDKCRRYLCSHRFLSITMVKWKM